jgi:PhzF family phenazine biosynthesis protein
LTPTVEVELCGHATLAAAHVLFNHGHVADDEVQFASRSGELTVRRDGDLLVLDFPADPPNTIDLNDAFGESLVRALGTPPAELHVGRYHLAIFDSGQQVAELQPDFSQLAALPHYAVVCSAPGFDCDFVSRFFGPRVGVDEDPVTGSAHCMLVPYWSERLGKTQLHARQISARGGELFCVDQGKRVRIAGHATDYMTGTILV